MTGAESHENAHDLEINKTDSNKKRENVLSQSEHLLTF